MSSHVMQAADGNVTDRLSSPDKLPITAIVAAKNEEKNLPRCLEALRDVAEVYVVDSGSTDATPEIARSFGANVARFHYQGGWPKKRQWAMDSLSLSCDWILLVDADEVLTPELAEEIRTAVASGVADGYYISLKMYFLGRVLRHGDANFWKLSLFRRGKGHYECRLKDQNASMADMEIHEHVVVDGPTGRLANPLIHHNVESLSRYIQKHDEYSNWEARVLLQGSRSDAELPASFWGTQAQRRRWLKRKLYALPGSPVLLFLYRYIFRGGFLDGVPGLIYCGFQAIQMFHTKAKMYELRSKTKTV
ncbi:MAG TPA: glycosyltransferase family 2 protein [Candidatus Sulfotelmatobacter sp.]|nr:glycosyltransferase family 2 protein [Candidatus Sulfotelmatobacter sp.]